jgi:hypothetical protein
MTRSFAMSALASALVFAACSGPASPTSVPGANAGTSPSAQPGSTTPVSQSLAVPFKGTLEGNQSVTPLAFPLLAVEGSASGNATHLGRFTAHFPHTVNLTTRDAVGTYTFTAANGDTLTADFTGHAEGMGVVSIEEHATVTGGTGRFEGASGSITILRQFEQSTGLTSGAFEGQIALRQGQP